MRRRLLHVLLPVTKLGMEACWLYAWLAVIETRVLAGSAIAAISLAFAVAGAVERSYLARSPMGRTARLVCYWLSWFVLSAIAAKLLLYPEMSWGQPAWVFALPVSAIRLIFETRTAELLLLGGSIIAWHLGGRAASGEPTHESLLGQFQFGLIMLVGAFLAGHALGVSAGQPVLLALAFFLLSLTGIAVTRSRREEGQPSLPRSRPFTGSLVALIAIVSALGLLAGVAITPGLIGLLLDAGRHVLDALQSAIVFILSHLPQPDFTADGAEVAPPATGDDSGLLEFYRSLPWPVLLRRVVYILWVAIMLGIFLFALWRICSLVLDWWKRRGSMSGIEVESLDTGFLADLIALLRWCGRKTRELVQRAMRFARRSTQVAGEPTWVSVYAAFARWAGRKVSARPVSQSVLEYQAALTEFLPAAAPDLAFVTETYSRARYGRHEPDRHVVQQMQDAVRRIRKAPRRPTTHSTNTQIEGAE